VVQQPDAEYFPGRFQLLGNFDIFFAWIQLIQDPDIIRQTLKHLGLWKQDAGSRCKKPKPDHGPVVYEKFDDGWPPYEESESILH
jgi:hypothetical protein